MEASEAAVPAVDAAEEVATMTATIDMETLAGTDAEVEDTAEEVAEEIDTTDMVTMMKMEATEGKMTASQMPEAFWKEEAANHARDSKTSQLVSSQNQAQAKMLKTQMKTKNQIRTTPQISIQLSNSKDKKKKSKKWIKN